MQLADLDRFSLALFDFDGTIADTEPLHYESYKQMLKNRGFTLDWDLTTYLKEAHVSTEYLFKQFYTLFPKLYEQESDFWLLREEKSKIYETMIETTPISILPGVQECIDYLLERRKIIAIVTNSSKKHLDKMRESSPLLQKFHRIITKDDYQEAKPSPQGYLFALNQFQKKPDETIAFEDSIKGIASALAADLQVVLIASLDYAEKVPYHQKLTHIESFSDLIVKA